MRDSTRFTCARGDSSAIQRGGRWTSPQGDAGFYRMIVASPPVGWGAPRVFLQWVGQPTSTDSESVRATIEIPLVPRFLTLDEARLQVHRDSSACLIVRSSGKGPHWVNWDVERKAVILGLGPPGDTIPVPQCLNR